VVNVIISGINNPSAQLLNLYPNPAKDQVMLEVPNENSKLKLMNLHGAVVLELNALPSGKTPVSVSGFAKGTYLVMIQSADAIHKGTLVIEE
jgi:hypothetical protein